MSVRTSHPPRPTDAALLRALITQVREFTPDAPEAAAEALVRDPAFRAAVAQLAASGTRDAVERTATAEIGGPAASRYLGSFGDVPATGNYPVAPETGRHTTLPPAPPADAVRPAPQPSRPALTPTERLALIRHEAQGLARELAAAATAPAAPAPVVAPVEVVAPAPAVLAAAAPAAEEDPGQARRRHAPGAALLRPIVRKPRS